MIQNNTKIIIQKDNKTIQECLTLIILKKKTKNSIIQIGQKFLTIHIEY